MDSKQTGLSIPTGCIVMFQCRYDVNYDTAVICMDNEKPSSTRCGINFETSSSFCWQSICQKCMLCYGTAHFSTSQCHFVMYQYISSSHVESLTQPWILCYIDDWRGKKTRPTVLEGFCGAEFFVQSRRQTTNSWSDCGLKDWWWRKFIINHWLLLLLLHCCCTPMLLCRAVRCRSWIQSLLLPLCSCVALLLPYKSFRRKKLDLSEPTAWVHHETQANVLSCRYYHAAPLKASRFLSLISDLQDG